MAPNNRKKRWRQSMRVAPVTPTNADATATWIDRWRRRDVVVVADETAVVVAVVAVRCGYWKRCLRG